jgi:hypothetical protein
MEGERRHRISYFLVVTGFAASLALHVASFWAPAIAEYGLWIGLVYAVVILFKNLTSFRRRPFRTDPGPAAGGGGPAPGRVGAPPGEPPPWARWVYIFQLVLWGYSIIWVIQLCVAPGSEVNPALVRAWSALGLALFFRWALEIAQRLGWWGGWRPGGA